MRLEPAQRIRVAETRLERSRITGATIVSPHPKPICHPQNATLQSRCRQQRDCTPDIPAAVSHFQPFPTEGPLFHNLDLQKPELQRRIGHLPGKVRSYKMTSVGLNESGLLQQEGSGPNFQGGYLTLCTCQFIFRAEKRQADEWLDDWWIAGFTTPKYSGRIWLFYLAQIERVCASHAETWKALPKPARQAKSVRRSRLGDIYQPDPSSACRDPFDPAHYYPPLVGHSHHATATDDEWERDISFFHPTFKRHPVLLIAKPRRTFPWQSPRLFLTQHPRNRTWDSVATMLASLRSSRSAERAD
jgi:hypothetical protein